MKKGLIIVVVLVLVIAGITAMWGVGVSNTEIETVALGEAQEKSCEAFHDKMWKVLQEQAGVANEYKDAFAEIYPALMEGRYSTGGGMMKWVQEANPEFDTSLYAKLMASIEGQREGFFVEQQKLIDIDKKHKIMRKTFPNKLIVGNRANIGYLEENGKVVRTGIMIITSASTKEAYATGEDNKTLF